MKAGFLNIVKPPGLTSHGVVAQVRRRLPRKTKVGHLGTLDPGAAGVLPVAVGQATKLIPYLPDLGDRMKGYLGLIQFGVTTSTDDLEGEVLSECDGPVGRESLVKALGDFRGAIEQIPPQVSAVRQDGKRAYKLAREGKKVELKARRVLVSELELLEYHEETRVARIFLLCGSGTYVRSVARDLGRVLGVGGALAFLLRTLSGPFGLADAVTLEELWRDGLEAHTLPSDYPFSHLPYVEPPEPLVQKGQRVNLPLRPDTLFRAPGGLLRASEQPEEAVVEALLPGVSV